MRALLILMLLAVASIAVGQQLNPVRLGDTVPELVFPEVMNADNRAVRLSDYKGKAVLLDFWSTWCSVCIRQFAKLAAFRETFGDDLVVLTVGFDGIRQGSIGRFVDDSANREKLCGLPVAVQHTDDTVLQHLFPFRSLPHVVWIDADGVLRAVTDHLQVDSMALVRLINGEASAVRNRRFQRDYRPGKPYLLHGNGGRDDAFSARMIITGYNDSIPGTPQIRFDSESCRLFYPNQTVRSLFRYAMLGRGLAGKEWLQRDVGLKRLRIEGQVVAPVEWHDLQGLSPDAIETFYSSLHCYELILPPSSTAVEAYRQMNAHLAAYFGFEAVFERRLVDVLLLDAGGYELPDGAASITLHQLVDKLNITFPEAMLFIIGDHDALRPVDIAGMPAGSDFQGTQRWLESRGVRILREKHRVECLVLFRADRK